MCLEPFETGISLYMYVFYKAGAGYMYMYSAPTSQKAHCIPIAKIIVWENND